MKFPVKRYSNTELGPAMAGMFDRQNLEQLYLLVRPSLSSPEDKKL